MKGAQTARQLGALLDVNRAPGPAVRPAKIKAARSPWISEPELEFYVDFETVSDIDDDFSAIPDRGGHPLVFMVGCGHVEDSEWRFECFVAGQLTEPAEAVVINQWLDHMAAVRRQLAPGSRPRVIHWSAHEVSSMASAFNAAAKRHGSRAKRWPAPQVVRFPSASHHKGANRRKGSARLRVEVDHQRPACAGPGRDSLADRAHRRARRDGRDVVVPKRDRPAPRPTAHGLEPDARDPRLQRGRLQIDDGDRALTTKAPLISPTASRQDRQQRAGTLPKVSEFESVHLKASTAAGPRYTIGTVG